MFRSFFIVVIISFNCYAKPIEISVAAPEIFPFVYLDEKQETVGLLVDCLNNNINKDYDFKVLVLPWARALKEVKNNRIDALMPTMFTEQRASYLSYPDTPMFNLLSDVLVKKASSQFTTFENAKMQNELIGKVRSKALKNDIRTKIESSGLTILTIKDTSTALQMILQNRIDYFIGDPQIVKKIAQQSNTLNKFSFVNLSDETIPSFLTFSKNFSKKNDINEIMKSIDCSDSVMSKFIH